MQKSHTCVSSSPGILDTTGPRCSPTSQRTLGWQRLGGGTTQESRQLSRAGPLCGQPTLPPSDRRPVPSLSACASPGNEGHALTGLQGLFGSRLLRRGRGGTDAHEWKQRWGEGTRPPLHPGCRGLYMGWGGRPLLSHRCSQPPLTSARVPSVHRKSRFLCARRLLQNFSGEIQAVVDEPSECSHQKARCEGVNYF